MVCAGRWRVDKRADGSWLQEKNGQWSSEGRTFLNAVVPKSEAGLRKYVQVPGQVPIWKVWHLSRDLYICLKSAGDVDIQGGLGGCRSQGSLHSYSYRSSTYISRTRGSQEGIRCEGCINLMFHGEGPSRLGLEHMATVSISCIKSGIYPAGCQYGTHLEHYIHSAIQKGRLFKNTQLG